MSLRRALATALTVLLSPALVTVAAAPAHAAGGSTSAEDGVIYQCHDHSYRYSVNLPEYTEDWSMDVILEGPDGLEASSDFVYDAAASGRSDLQICSFYLPGTYTIRATVSAYDYDYNNTTFDLAPSKFTLRKPRTQTTVKASTTNPSKGQVVRFNVVSKDERPKGYFPNDYADVILQALKGGKWVNVKGTKGYTNSSGRTVLKVRFAGKAVKVRARTLGDEYNTGSYSGTLTLR